MTKIAQVPSKDFQPIYYNTEFNITITIQPHNPAWKLQFQTTKSNLESILQDVQIISIEHVGSTAIPDLIAKPIIDIDINVNAEYLSAARAAMTSAGYEDRGDLGVPGRVAFRALALRPKHEAIKQKADESYELCKENVYVVVEGSISLRNHLVLRRVLLHDVGFREEYGNVKKDLVASGLSDVDEYCRGKTNVILRMLGSVGWSEEELEKVRNANE